MRGPDWEEVAAELVAAMERLFAGAGDQDDDMAAVARTVRPA